MILVLFVVALLEHPPEPGERELEIFQTAAVVGDPLRGGMAKVALLVEKAVPVQEVVRVPVVGEELTLQVLVAALLAGVEVGHRGLEVQGQSLTLSRVATLVLVPCSGCCEYYHQDHHEHCHLKSKTRLSCFNVKTNYFTLILNLILLIFI